MRKDLYTQAQASNSSWKAPRCFVGRNTKDLYTQAGATKKLKLESAKLYREKQKHIYMLYIIYAVHTYYF